MRILLFAGAGTSVELGVPSAAGLARAFARHVQQWDVESQLVEQLMGDRRDLEFLVERVDNLCGAKGEIDVGVNPDLVNRAERIRGEVEWFVQHAAEKVGASDAQLMWVPFLRTTASAQVTFATTNYDRAFELAANAEGIHLNDGFEASVAGEISRWVGFGEDDKRVALIKLHGSTNWYTDQGSMVPVKLKHPMPLFGNALLRFDQQDLGSALVLPSREKILTRKPYPRLSQMFLNSADIADLALFVGASLRDNHIRSAAESLATKIPVILVNPDAASATILNAKFIQQTASEFLISTLPNALAASDPIQFLSTLGQLPPTSRASESVPDCGILANVRIAIDDDAGSVERCLAIDELVNLRATLPIDWMHQILNGEDADVARYALGLVPQSSCRQKLIAIAEASVHMEKPSYSDELEMLRKLDST